MLLAAISVVLVSLVAGDFDTDLVPDAPTIVEEYSHSANLSIDGSDVPEDTTSVHIQAKELDDLTGNNYESGYDFPYNADVPFFYYPQLNDNQYHVFRLKFGNHQGEYTQYSADSSYSHADKSRISLVEMERTWPEAHQYCISEGKRLVVVHSWKINNMMKSIMQSEDIDTAWIGLYDEHYNDNVTTTTWKWVDNTKYNWNNFEVGAVEDSTLATAAVSIDSLGQWETSDPSDKNKFFCEDLRQESLNKRHETISAIQTGELDV